MFVGLEYHGVKDSLKKSPALRVRLGSMNQEVQAAPLSPEAFVF
jgi:hypothetical protein